jgi:hypothetical protein
MTTASLLLLALGLLGAFDVFYFHHRTARLTSHPAARSEVWFHVARGFVYAAQFLIVPNVAMHGSWLFALGALYVADIAIAMGDVWLEPMSRKELGGLPRGEYLMHIVLSVIVGLYLNEMIRAAWAWRLEPTAVVWHADGVPLALRVTLALFAVGCAAVSILEAIVLLLPKKPVPLHVSVRVPADIPALWRTTQDHVLHPVWDHRFSHIQMLSDDIRTGTEMVYEKRIFGLTIRGGGRYKLHKPMKQSTFEFWSSDPRSLIAHGVGLWLYRSISPGVVELSTSYTYEVRWGILGRVVDHFIFRPWFQRETERSFARLASLFFGVERAPVGGARGRKPERLGDRAAPSWSESVA